MHLEFTKVVAAIKAAIPIAKILAGITTATQSDDKAVQIVEATVNDQGLIDFITNILNDQPVMALAGPERTRAIALAAEKFATPQVKAAAANLGFDWTMILQYLPQIITLILTALGLRR